MYVSFNGTAKELRKVNLEVPGPGQCERVEVFRHLHGDADIRLIPFSGIHGDKI